MCAGNMLPWASSIGAYNSCDAGMTHVLTSGEGFLDIPEEKHHEFQEQYAMEAMRIDTSLVLSELPFPLGFSPCSSR